MTTSASRDPDPARDPVFSRLVAELEEIGFEPKHWDRHTTVYAATDTDVLVAVVVDPSDRYACLSLRRDARTVWTMHWTPNTPDTVQLIALYAAVNDDPAAALAAAAAALGIPPPAGPVRPSPTAG